MRKLLVLGLVAGLIAGAYAMPATAGKRKAKPVATTLYLHGTEMAGEAESFPGVSTSYLPMDTKEPEGTATKSKQLTNYVRGPNNECAGNSLWPVWVGRLEGSVKGDVKVTLNTVATPGKILIRIWPDVMSQMCTQEALGSFDYPKPAGEVLVDVPPGPGVVEAVIKGVKFKAVSSLMIQVSPEWVDDPGYFPPFQGRVLYDSESAVSKIELTCTPSSGSTCA